MKYLILALLCFPFPLAAEMTATLHLTDLTLVVEGDTGPALVAPIAAGGIWFGRSFTPVFDGWLQNRRVIMKRKEPHFKSLPFIRMSDKLKGYLPYGIHVTPFDKLERGYISHGCIHLSEKDLRKLLYLLGREKEIRLKVTYEPTPFLSDYPYAPFYYRPKNFGTEDRPLYKRDEWNLIILERVSKSTGTVLLDR